MNIKVIYSSVYASNHESLWHHIRRLFGLWLFLDSPEQGKPAEPQHTTTEFRHVCPFRKSLCDLSVPLGTNCDLLPVRWSGCCWMGHLHLNLGPGKTHINHSVSLTEIRGMWVCWPFLHVRSHQKGWCQETVWHPTRKHSGEQAVVILGGKQYMETLHDSIHYFLCAHGTTDESATVHGL